MEELGLFVRLGGYLVGEVSPIKNLRHGRRRRKMISDVLRNAKLAPIILHGRKMMGTAPASCLNLPKHFGSLYLEPVFFPHGQKPASAVSVFKQAILRYPPHSRAPSMVLVNLQVLRQRKTLLSLLPCP